MLYFYLQRYVANSNGISLLYDLVEKLSSMGKNAKVLCYQHRLLDVMIPVSLHEYIIYLDEQHVIITDSDIVFYIETTDGNPLKAKHVVRYLLNRPLVLTSHPVQYEPTDYLLSYSNYVDTSLPQLCYMKDERAIFEKYRTCKKKGTVLYFGKTNPDLLSKEIAVFHSLEGKFPKPIRIIVREYPKDHLTTLEWLAKAELLVSFDGMTNMNYEATLLDTPAFVLDDSYHLQDIPFNVPQPGIFYQYQALSKAMALVKGSYPAYVKFLETQNALAFESIEKIENHFEKMDTDSQYREANKKRNEAKSLSDVQQWKGMNHVTYYNINTITQVPKDFYRYADKGLKKTQNGFALSLKEVLKHLGLFHVAKKVYYNWKNWKYNTLQGTHEKK